MMVPIVSNISMKKQMKISGSSSIRWRNTVPRSALNTIGIGSAGRPTIPESWIFLKDTPIIPFGVQYEDNKKISDALKSVPAVLLANDSVLITGDGLLQTFDRLEVAEFSAKSLIMAAPIGELKPITDKEVEDLRVAFHVK